MSKEPQKLMLADDDPDDCMFFKEALEEIPLDTDLTTVNDGVELMQFLNATAAHLPDLLFLDLNMPLKAGFQCLVEIKENEKLKELPVIIYSTSMDHDVVNMLYEKGAHYYICKPPEFSLLKKVIHEALLVTMKNGLSRPPKEKFVIQVQ
ncbi:MAG TPA: response regulator [Ferruginibacter sp.]|nr:response regulator [Ferruginibacter sp.]